MSDMKSWRGLKTLLVDAVEHGASAVERVHMQTARRPFEILKNVPTLEEPVEGIQGIHDAIVTGVYGSVRLVNRVLGRT